MGLSALCLVPCLALSWLLAILPVMLRAAMPKAFRDNNWLHAGLILPVLYRADAACRLREMLVLGLTGPGVPKPRAQAFAAEVSAAL